MTGLETRPTSIETLHVATAASLQPLRITECASFAARRCQAAQARLFERAVHHLVDLGLSGCAAWRLRGHLLRDGRPAFPAAEPGTEHAARVEGGDGEVRG